MQDRPPVLCDSVPVATQVQQPLHDLPVAARCSIVQQGGVQVVPAGRVAAGFQQALEDLCMTALRSARQRIAAPARSKFVSRPPLASPHIRATHVSAGSACGTVSADRLEGLDGNALTLMHP